LKDGRTGEAAGVLLLGVDDRESLEHKEQVSTAEKNAKSGHD
jgi:hypothetical protein